MVQNRRLSGKSGDRVDRSRLCRESRKQLGTNIGLPKPKQNTQNHCQRHVFIEVIIHDDFQMTIINELFQLKDTSVSHFCEYIRVPHAWQKWIQIMWIYRLHVRQYNKVCGCDTKLLINQSRTSLDNLNYLISRCKMRPI